MNEQLAVERIERATSRSFEDVIAVFETLTSDLTDGVFERELAAAKDVEDFERRMSGYLAESGFMRLQLVDHGALQELYGSSLTARLYALGNPLFARMMMAQDPAVGLNLPVRILIWQAPSGEVRLAYDRPSSLMGKIDTPRVLGPAQKLDEKIGALVRQVMGV